MPKFFDHLLLLGYIAAMRPIATDGITCSVCLCLCLSVTFVGHAKWMNRLRRGLWGGDSRGHNEPCIRWGRDPPQKGQYLWDVRPIVMHWKSLLWCMQQKGLFNRQQWHAALILIQSSITYNMQCGLSSKFFDHLLLLLSTELFWLIELSFYVPLDTKQVSSELQRRSSQPVSWLSIE